MTDALQAGDSASHRQSETAAILSRANRTSQRSIARTIRSQGEKSVSEDQYRGQSLIKQERGTSRRDLLRLASSSLVLIPVLQLTGCGNETASTDAPAAADSSAAGAAPAADAESMETPIGEVPETLPSYDPIPEEQTGDMPKLSPSDPAGSALGYVENENDVDVDRFDGFENGQNCGNCAQFRGEVGVDWGPCVIFPGKLVSAVGWCAGYIAQT